MTRERQTEHAGFPEAGGEPSGFTTLGGISLARNKRGDRSHIC